MSYEKRTITHDSTSSEDILWNVSKIKTFSGEGKCRGSSPEDQLWKKSSRPFFQWKRNDPRESWRNSKSEYMGLICSKLFSSFRSLNYLMLEIIKYNWWSFQCIGYDGLNCVPSKFLCWSTNPRMWLFKDRTFSEIIMLKGAHKGEP